MHILLTGSAGFIGFHTSRALLERGDTVIGFDNFCDYYDATLKEKRNTILEEYENFHLVRGDLKNMKDLEQAFDLLEKEANRLSLTADRSRVCHLAAQAGVRHSIEHPDEFIQDNVVGFGNIIELAKNRNVGGFIFASTSAVYGNSKEELLTETDRTDAQVSLYGVTKKSNELQAAAYHSLFGLHCTGLRFFTVYGPYGRPDMALFLFTDAILHDRPINVFGHGKMQRDFTYVDDIVSGVVAALDKNYPLEIFNLGGDKTEELMDFISLIEKECGKEAEKNMLPMQQGDVIRTAANVGRAREMLDYNPQTHIAEGIPKFVEWYREYYGV